MANNSTARNDFFKQLKPICIGINNLAVRSTDKTASSQDLIRVVESLSTVLEAQVAQDASVLDEKLAEYIFFPLSNILRNQPQYPIRLTELTIKCLQSLIQYGWKSKIPLDLAQQLLILLTFIIGGVPGQDKKTPLPEETELETFKALCSLLRATGSSIAGAAALVDTNTIPTLGHAVSIVLDGITDGRTSEIQLEALHALNALFDAIKDRSALATFMPGIVSSLNRLLTPPKALKIRKRVLIEGISALKNLLTKVLGDIQVMGILKKKEAPSPNSTAGADGGVLTASWLRASTAKVKLALASVLKLRNHDSDDVRLALRGLCITLLDECHQSLSESISILVETAMILSDDSDREGSVLETSLTDLARVYPELTDTIKTTVYNWVTSLPRLMQTSEARTKQQAMDNLLKGLYFVSNLQIDSSTLENMLAASLRDSSTALLLGSKPANVLSELPSSALELYTTDVVKNNGTSVFQPVLMGQETEKSTRAAIISLVTQFGTVSQQIRLAREMLDYVRESTGPSQVASYWIAFELVKSIHSQSSGINDFIDFTSSTGPPDETEATFHEIYTFSLAVLDSQADVDEADWRLQALAIEVTTFTASRLAMGFRAELIDTLYPIATFLGSDNPHVRAHAIVGLNNIAASCGYLNVTELIIDNVDYMVNSVSLRLNTFDISPASTQVLRMMTKLTGPKLIPYLDDVVASIFAALDNYHGYTSFVEGLFSVLIEVVVQGTRSEQLLLGEAKPSHVDHKKSSPRIISTNDILSDLAKRLERKRKRLEEEMRVEDMDSHPKRPWKATKTATELLDEADQEANEEPEDQNTEVEKQPPAKTPTFQLLSRITDLTQHYMTSPSPTLRRSLLELLSIVFPALSPDEETFLPLVNSIWPVLIERLYDPETFVVISSCKALSALCQSAGDFLSTRIKTEWWDSLGKWCTKIKSEATQSKGKARAGNIPRGNTKNEHVISFSIRSRNDEGSMKSSSALESTSNTGLGKFTQAAQAWEAAQGLLVSIASFVRIDDEIFDQILFLLADVLASKPEARAALEAVDADAVWLLMYQQGVIKPPPQPTMVGTTFVALT